MLRVIALALIASSARAARLASSTWTLALEYSAALDTVLVTELSFFAAGNFTVNLAMQPGDAAFPFTSASTLLVQAADGARSSLRATCGGVPCAVTASPDGRALTATGLSHGGLDDEVWTIALADGGATLTWASARTARAAHALVSDRLALAFQTIGFPPIHGNQIPSWLDIAMRFNESAAAGFALGEGQFEFLSAPAQTVKWAPTGALMSFAGTAAGAGAASDAAFSFAKPAMDGTSHVVTLGLQAAAGRAEGAPVSVPAGAALQRGFSLTMLPEGSGTSFPQLNFTMPAGASNDKFAGLLREFASVQNMFEGFFFGNNPASVSCLHEMGWFPLIQSIYPAGSLGLAAVQREFEYFAACGWDNGASRNGTDSPYVSCLPGAGGMVHRLASNGFYNAPWGALQDQNMHFIIGAHALSLATGDVAAARRLLPAVLRIADYLEANGLAATGIFTSPASGIANGGACPSSRKDARWEPACGSSNWYDVVLQGHLDGYNALLTVWALECLTDLLAWLGDADRSAHYAALHARAVDTFNDVMWSESEAQYADWIDAANNARYYFFSDVQMKAVFLGVANATRGAAVMARYDAHVAKLVSDFNVTLDDVWGPPSNVVPITNPLEFVLELEPIEPNVPFPAYENGGSFFHSVGYESLARAAVGDSAASFTSFQRFLYNAYAANRGWAQQAYFNTQALVGTDPLNDSLLAAWGFLHAGFGFKSTLSHGLVKTGTPPPQLEGATHTFGFLGADVCVTVVGGAVERCGGGW